MYILSEWKADLGHRGTIPPVEMNIPTWSKKYIISTGIVNVINSLKALLLYCVLMILIVISKQLVHLYCLWVLGYCLN